MMTTEEAIEHLKERATVWGVAVHQMPEGDDRRSLFRTVNAIDAIVRDAADRKDHVTLMEDHTGQVAWFATRDAAANAAAALAAATARAGRAEKLAASLASRHYKALADEDVGSGAIETVLCEDIAAYEEDKIDPAWLPCVRNAAAGMANGIQWTDAAANLDAPTPTDRHA